MKRILLASTALCIAATSSFAAGLDRSNQSVTDVFNDSGEATFSWGRIMPSVTGKDDAGNNYDVGEAYTQTKLSFTQDITDRLSYTIIADQPYGALTDYNNDPTSSALGGTGADLSSEAVTLLGKFQLNDRISFFGGVKAQRVRAKVTLNGTAYAKSFVEAASDELGATVLTGVTEGVNAAIAGTGLPPLTEGQIAAINSGDTAAQAAFIATYGLGFAVQSGALNPNLIPLMTPAQIAGARALGGQGGIAQINSSFTTGNALATTAATNGFYAGGGYNFEMEDSTELGAVIGAAYEIPDIAFRLAATYHLPVTHKADTTESVLGQRQSGKVEYTTPQALNLDFQTGIAADTLLTASFRWAQYSKLDVEPELLGQDLVNLDDARRFTLGVARRFNDNLAGNVTLSYEPAGDDLVSPLGPTNGLRGISIGGLYTNGNFEASAGFNYSELGDAKANVGDVGVVDFEGSSSRAFGFNVSYKF